MRVITGNEIDGAVHRRESARSVVGEKRSGWIDVFERDGASAGAVRGPELRPVNPIVSIKEQQSVCEEKIERSATCGSGIDVFYKLRGPRSPIRHPELCPVCVGGAHEEDQWHAL